MSRRIPSKHIWVLALALLVICPAALTAFHFSPSSPALSALDAKPDQEKLYDPALIAGHEKCVDCHAVEIKSWLASKHASRAYDLLINSDSALDYAKELSIRPAEITKNSICIDCHGTRQIQWNARIGVIPSVSCEACHGAAGGEQGWLNVHAVYGRNDTLRTQETPDHYRARIKRCDKSGQLRSSNLYGLTKRCFRCHVVGNEELAIAGHDHGDGFEMIAKSLGEVRHNFVLDERTNAKVATLWSDPLRHKNSRNAAGRLRIMFILGQMVDLEISLRNLAKASAENDFSDAMIHRIEDAYEVLTDDILNELENADKDPAFAEIKSIVELAKPVISELNDNGFSKQDRQQYTSVANAIANKARKFSKRDGSQLVVVDDLDLLPEDFFEGAFDPNALKKSGK